MRVSPWSCFGISEAEIRATSLRPPGSRRARSLITTRGSGPSHERPLERIADAAGFGQDDGDLLNGVWIIWIEATLLHAERNFEGAHARIDEALALDQGELRARLLYTKARIVEATADLRQSTALLAEAASLVDLSREPRFAAALKLQLLVNLCDQGRASEAEQGLAALHQLTESLGREPDLFRVLWLQGRVGAALGRITDARTCFDEVRRYFEQHGIAYDYALVSLELSLVLLKDSETARVRILATEMFWIFHSQGVPENALAALRVFCEAAEREEATIELTQRVLDFLRRTTHDSGAVFSSEGS